MLVDENAKTTVTKAARVISAVCGTGGRAVARVKKGKVVAGEIGTKNQSARSSPKLIARTKNASSSWPW
jgi:hypothetical protein